MSVFAYKDKALGLAVGVDWSVLSTDVGKPNGNAIRKRAGLIGASGYCTHQFDNTTYIGLFTEPAALLGTKNIKPKRSHSLATAFINAFNGTDHAAINAVLLMTPETDSPSDSKKLAIVVIEGGQVIWNKLDDYEAAILKAREFSHAKAITYAFFGNVDAITGTQPISWGQLVSAASSQSEFKKIPANLIALGVIGLLVAAACAAYAYKALVVDPAKAKARAKAQQIAENHTPQYEEKLGIGLSKAGWDRANILAFLQEQKTQIAYAKGWELKAIKCDSDTAICDYKFARIGGEIKELIALEADKKYDEANSKAMADAVFTKSIKPSFKALTRAEIPKTFDANVALKNQAQRLSNAGASIKTEESKPWPEGVDFAKVDTGILIKRSGFEVGTSYPMVDKVIAELPAHVLIKSFVMTFNVGGDKADNVKINLKGFSYAK